MTIYFATTGGTLQHHGVKGMRWGVRKKRTWSKEPEGYSIKQQSKELRSKDRYQKAKGISEKITARKEYKEVQKEGRNKIKEYRQFEKDMHKKLGPTSKLRKEIVDGKTVYKNKKTGETFQEHEYRGAKEYENRMRYTAQTQSAKVVKTARNLITASLADDIFLGGAGKKLAKETVKQTGRAVISAYIMARGGWDIRWYDN